MVGGAVLIALTAAYVAKRETPHSTQAPLLASPLLSATITTALPTNTEAAAVLADSPKDLPVAGSATLAPPASALGTAKAEATGSVSAKDVNATVRAHQSEVMACREAAHQRNHALKGKVFVRASVASTGRVNNAQVAGSTVRDAKLDTCVLGAFRTWSFPKPTGHAPAPVSFTFNFE
jgi:TonB family protein